MPKQLHIIFDMDGTIFDTEFEVSRITSDIAMEYGICISPERVFCEFAGLGAREKFVEIAKAEKTALSEDAFTAMGKEHEIRKNGLYLLDHIPVVPYIPDVFAVLKRAKHLLSIGSTNNSPRQRLGLEKAGFLHYFGDRLYGPDLTEGRKKPDPAIFLLAMKENKSMPANTVVVEDTEVGIVAGRAAGAFVIAYLDPRFGTGEAAARKTEQFKKSGANSIIRSFHDFMNALPEQKSRPIPKSRLSLK